MMTFGEQLGLVAKRTYENRRDIEQKNRQRRTGFVDLYGTEYTAYGSAEKSATFYISISEDLVYYERFQFKLYVEATSDAIPDEFTISIHGVDITDYLMEQHEGEWVDGEGLFPNNKTEEDEDFYDILDVACMMTAEGNTEEAELLLKPEFKKVQIKGNAPFSVSLINYMKYSHINR